MTNLIVAVNVVDATVNKATTPADYIDVDLVNDKLIWSAGSAAVYDNCGYIPNSTQLDAAASIISSVAVEVAHCFLADNSATNLRSVIGASSGNNRYVFCFSFDNATATEPTLEAWDTNTHTTSNFHVLGNGTPANSMFHAICTTAGSPGASWSGTHLAGSSKVNLNNGSGALGAAGDLYANIYILIPASYATAENSTPVLTVRYTYA